MSVPLTESPGTLRPLLRLAVPVLVEQFLLMLVGFSDTILTGHYLEQDHLAAMNLMAYVLWLSFGMFAAVSIGATAMVARFVGAGDRASARTATGQAMLLGGALAAVVTLVGCFMAGRLPGLMQMTGEPARLATVYLWFIVPVLPMIMIEAVGVACLRGAGDMVGGLAVMAATNAVNIGVSWTLVLGPGPIPELGWIGIATGTACGHTFGALLVLAMLARGRAGLSVPWRRLRPHGDLIRRLLRIGVPGGMDTLLIISCHFWFVTIINRLGPLASAAHGVAIRIESLAFLSGAAFQVAATTTAGQYLGAGDYRRAGRSVVWACVVGGGVMTAAGALFFAFPLSLASVFVRSGQLDVARQAVPLLQIVAVAMPAFSITMILSGALRGAGDTRWPLIFSLIGFTAVRIPLAHWFAFEQLSLFDGAWTIEGWGLGVAGAWYGMFIDLHVRAALILYRFFHGGWKRVKV